MGEEKGVGAPLTVDRHKGGTEIIPYIRDSIYNACCEYGVIMSYDDEIELAEETMGALRRASVAQEAAYLWVKEYIFRRVQTIGRH